MDLLFLIGVGVYMIGHALAYYPVNAPFPSAVMALGGVLVLVSGVV